MKTNFLKLLFPTFLLTSCFDPEDEPKQTSTKPSEEKNEETTPPKKEEPKVEIRGTYHLAIAGNDFSSADEGKYLYDGVNRFTQDIQTSAIGKEYTNTGKVTLQVANSKWNYDASKTSATFEDYLNKVKNYNIDSLFVKVTNSDFNNIKIKKILKEEDTLKKVDIFMAGKENQSSLVQKFAGDNISTGIYNRNIASYIAGFQSAVGSIKFNTKNKEFLETETSFFIGAVSSDSNAIRKANAFRRGVIAASEHSDYSDFLKVNFVSKELDPGDKDSLVHSISDWKKDNRIYNTLNKSSFKDGDHQIIYLAGASAKDWRGTSVDDNEDNVDTGDDVGLIGSLYNYKPIASDDTAYDDLKQWDFSNSIGLVLDEHSTIEDANKTSIKGDNSDVNRHNLKVMGSIGGENWGDWAYGQLAIKHKYLNFIAPDFYQKHFLYGAPLNIFNNNVFEQSNYDFSYDSPYADETFRPSLWTVFKWRYDTNKLTSNEEDWLGS